VTGALALSIATGVLAAAIASRAPVVTPAPAHPYAEGAPPGFSGGFSEQSCDACHFHAATNAGPGRLSIEGIPERFAAAEPYRVTISLTQEGMKLAGFQLTARFKDDGSQAGMFATDSSDVRTGIDAQSGVQYVGQRREGAAMPTPNASRWTVIWTAPSATRTVVFHVAANAANGDERADGDFVYTLTLETSGSKVPEFQRSKVMP
jgi:hypothetical protein